MICEKIMGNSELIVRKIVNMRKNVRMVNQMVEKLVKHVHKIYEISVNQNLGVEMKR